MAVMFLFAATFFSRIIKQTAKIYQPVKFVIECLGELNDDRLKGLIR